ncbi:MAG: hypothetical protein KC731_16135 [Myxococcales bacterium]|nr:hypothetical protein [Myxococcales bacterium]
MSPSSSSPDPIPQQEPKGALLLAGLLLVSLGVGCHRAVAPEFETASSLPDPPTTPGPVAVDRASPPPDASDVGSTDQSLLTLRTPLGPAAARATIDAFFDAVFAEDLSALAALVGPSATLRDTGRRSQGPVAHDLTSMWRQRFQKRDFQNLSGQLVYRPGDVTTFRAGELDSLPLAVHGLAEDVHATDLVLHVPVITHSVLNERLLGDDLYFWLRRRGSHYVIYAMAEDVPL